MLVYFYSKMLFGKKGEMPVWYTIYHHLPIGCEGSLTFLYVLFHPHVVVCTLHTTIVIV